MEQDVLNSVLKIVEYYKQTDDCEKCVINNICTNFTYSPNIWLIDKEKDSSK